MKEEVGRAKLAYEFLHNSRYPSMSKVAKDCRNDKGKDVSGVSLRTLESYVAVQHRK
jgi:hypothetical protein